MKTSRNPILDAASTTPWRRQLVRPAFLAPDIKRAILEGRQHSDLTLAELMKSKIPLRWSEQRRRFGVGAEKPPSYGPLQGAHSIGDKLWRLGGGGRSLMRTRLYHEFPVIRENTG